MASIIRPATSDDQEKLYALGLGTKELQVSATDTFMERDEFLLAIKNPRGVFLVAETQGTIAGFIYANTDDKDMMKKCYACIVYIVVAEVFREQGIAQQLYNACEQALKAKEVTNVYGWANVESNGAIIQFFSKQGFTQGHSYVWMDKKI